MTSTLMARGPSVSAVIPTRGRASMVVAAAASALAQSEGLLEVIVVIDGEDAATLKALEAMPESEPGGRLRIVQMEHPVGGAEARNMGVRAARGEWIAFLDDDDLWLEHKLAVQLAAAERCTAAEPVISSAVLARGPRLDAVWPRRLYRTGEPMGEYLFDRRGWTYGEALLQTSTLLARTDLLLRLPFESGLKKHQDWDWLLRVHADPAVEVVQVAEPLAIFHVEGDRASTGRVPDWRFSHAWAVERRALFTPRAFSAFVATECAAQAGRAGASAAERLSLLRAVAGGGSSTLRMWVLCAVFLVMPQRMRRAMRGMGAKLRRSGAGLGARPDVSGV
ncbi:MAG TPA: glycosyltransferase family 2 protein [Acidobacteriaceae bacterium]